MILIYQKKLIELENGEIGLIVSNSIIFYLILNNKFDEDFNIERKLHNDKYYGEYFDMITIKPGELVFVNLSILEQMETPTKFYFLS